MRIVKYSHYLIRGSSAKLPKGLLVKLGPEPAWAGESEGWMSYPPFSPPSLQSPGVVIFSDSGSELSSGTAGSSHTLDSGRMQQLAVFTSFSKYINLSERFG